MTDGCYGNIDSVVVNRGGFDNFPNDHFLFGSIEGMNIDKTIEACKHCFPIDAEGGKLCIADFNFLLGKRGNCRTLCYSCYLMVLNGSLIVLFGKTDWKTIGKR